MDEDFVERRPADLEIYRRLDAFAQVRLTPDATAMARIRTALMGQALALADARSAALTAPTPLPVALPERPAIVFPRPQRRAAAAVLAACLVVGIGAGSVAASQAGGRSTARACGSRKRRCPAIRWHARTPRSHGSMRGSRRCASPLGAAMQGLPRPRSKPTPSSWPTSTHRPLRTVRSPPSVDDDMARRQIVLMGLLDEVPAQAQDAIQHALQQGANAIDANGVDPHPGDPRRPGAGGQDGSQGGGGQGGGSQGQGPGTGQGAGQEQGAGHGSGPNREPTPDRTPKPTKPPKASAADPTPEAQPATPTATGGGKQNENRGSTRQDELSGGHRGQSESGSGSDN